MVEDVNDCGDFRIVVTDELCGTGEYEIRVEDENGNILDSDTRGFDFYRNQTVMKRVRKFVEKCLRDNHYPLEKMDFNKSWNLVKQSWQESLREWEANIRTHGQPEPPEEKESVPDLRQEEMKEEAETWLKSPDLITKIDIVIHYHLAGETKNAFLLFFIYISALTDSPIVIRPTGESSIGKSFLATRVARLCPEEIKIMRKGFSKMAPWNRGELDGEGNTVWDLENKIIVLLEEETSEEFLEQFRPILSRDERSVTYEVTDTESDQRETLEAEIRGWPAYVGIQVGKEMNEQEDTRAMKMTPDASPEKYDTAVGWDARQDSRPWENDEKERETEVVKECVRMLNPYYVIIPNLEKIKRHFPTYKARHMRDWKHFKGLVKAVALLHQKQRPIVEVDGKEYLIAAPTDVEIVMKVAEEALSETLAGVGKKEQKFWRYINENYEYVEGYQGLQGVYELCFGEKRSKALIREKYIDPLHNKGLIQIVEGSGNNPHKFSALGNLSTLSSELDKIVSSAFDSDFEDTSLIDLCTPERDVQGIHVDNIPKANSEIQVSSNPVTNPSKEKMEEVWGGVRTLDLSVHNENVLERSKEEEYGPSVFNLQSEDNADKFGKLKEEKSPGEVEELGTMNRDQEDKANTLMAIIRNLEEEYPEGIPVGNVKAEAKAEAIEADFADEFIKRKKRDGKLYSPSEDEILTAVR